VTTAYAEFNKMLTRDSSKSFYLDPETGEQLKSVTTILQQGVPKLALMQWYANTAAQTAIEELERLVGVTTDAERTELYNYLRNAPNRRKNERADVGKAVHRLIEADVLREPVPQGLLDSPKLSPYLRHFQAFVTDFQVTFEASEMIVANYTHSYAGTLDNIFRSPFINNELSTLGDVKTGGELDVKGVYAEAGMQESAYRFSEFAWLRDGSKVPMPRTYGGVVLHLRPEGCRVIPVMCGADMWAVFLHAKKVAEFSTGLAKQVVGAPLHPGDHIWNPGGECRYCGVVFEASEGEAA
jgi:hypothetical protein